MDPLSITTAIVSLAGAANAAVISLRKLASLRHLSATICAINNEVEELRLLLQDVDSMLIHHGTLSQQGLRAYYTQDPGLASLLASLGPARDRLRELEHVINTRLLRSNGTFNPLSFLSLEKRVLRLQNELHSSRVAIGGAVSILASSTTIHIQLQLDSVRIIQEQSHSLTMNSIASQQNNLMSALAPITVMQKRNTESLERMEDYLHSLATHAQDKLPWMRSAGGEAGGEHIQFALKRQKRCGQWCKCSCHRTSYMNTPKLLQNVFGIAYAGYSGVPLLRNPCDKKMCQGEAETTLYLNYFFPSWFLSRMLSIALDCARGYPEASFRTLRVRPSYDAIFTNACFDEVDSLKRLLVSGKASVLDISIEGGQSALHVCMLRGHEKVTRLLLQAGADPYLENYSHEYCALRLTRKNYVDFIRTPYDMAWSSILSFRGTVNAARYNVDALLDLFPSADACEERRAFTKIHKGVLGLLHFDLELEIIHNREAVDQSDADGRTALHWACARGDAQKTALLLQYGANPDKVDRLGQGPLRASLKADTPDCMRLLLPARADVEIRDNWGQSCLLAANYHPEAENFIPLLLAAGADVNATDYKGDTPLHAAVGHAHGGNPAAVKLLLQNGADLDRQDKFGESPILVAIARNAHKALPLLLKEFPNLNVRNNRHESLLHLADRTADILTLRILTEHKLCGLEVESLEREGKTRWEIGQERMRTFAIDYIEGDEESTRTISAEWESALETLLKRVKRNTSKTNSPYWAASADNSDTEGSLTESWHSALDTFAGTT